MKKEFKPINASEMTKKFEEILMNGDAIRIDSGGHDFFDVVPRNEINSWKANENVGNGDFVKITRAVEPFFQAVENLKSKGFVVQEKICAHSGCCQYSAYLYYLEGE